MFVLIIMLFCVVSGVARRFPGQCFFVDELLFIYLSITITRVGVWLDCEGVRFVTTGDLSGEKISLMCV